MSAAITLIAIRLRHLIGNQIAHIIIVLDAVIIPAGRRRSPTIFLLHRRLPVAKNIAHHTAHAAHASVARVRKREWKSRRIFIHMHHLVVSRAMPSPLELVWADVAFEQTIVRVDLLFVTCQLIFSFELAMADLTLKGGGLELNLK